jgi:serine/threonine protein kinase
LAPEVRHYVRDAGIENGTYTNAVDIWSFACVVYQLLAGKLPFPRGAIDLIPYCDGGAFPDGPLEPHSSLMGINFIKSVLVPRPQLRLSAVNALEAPWLSAGTKGKGIQQGTKTAFDFKMLSSHLAEISKAQSSHSGDTVFSDLDPFTYVSKSSTGLYSSGISPAGGSSPAVLNNEKQTNIDGVTIASNSPFWRNQHDINPNAPGPMPGAIFEPNLDTDIYGVTGDLSNPFRKSQIGVSSASQDTPQKESRSRPYSMVPNRRPVPTNPPNRSYDIQPAVQAESPVGQNDWGRDDFGFGSSSTTRTQDSGYRSAPGPRGNENFRGGFDPPSRRTADWMTDDEWEDNYENQSRGNIRWDNRERRPVSMRSSGEERGREMLIKGRQHR